MKVYVVMGLIDYSPSDPLGAFSTKERAETLIKTCKAPRGFTHGLPDRMRYYDDYDIEEFELDA